MTTPPQTKDAPSMIWGDARLPQRFWDKVQPEPNSGCWLWTASVNMCGYGAFGLTMTTRTLAHRVALMALLGRTLGESEFACHHCDTPSCVNPVHLFLGDNTANVRDMIAKGRGNSHTARARAVEVKLARTHCKQGHPLSGDNLYMQRNGNGSVARACRTCASINNAAKYRRRCDAMGAAK